MVTLYVFVQKKYRILSFFSSLFFFKAEKKSDMVCLYFDLLNYYS